MKILMLGWEYAPQITGGLGVASHGLAKALAQQNHNVTFLLPKVLKRSKTESVSVLDASNQEIDINLIKVKKKGSYPIKTLEIGVNLIPYLSPSYFKKLRKEQKISVNQGNKEINGLINDLPLTGKYGSSTLLETKKYALIAAELAVKENFDIVHAHDWMTFAAASLIKSTTGIPFIAHIHSTEIDRNEKHIIKDIFALEKIGMEEADRIIAVSKQVKTNLINNYLIDGKKIIVVPNGIEAPIKNNAVKNTRKFNIGFIGRFTDQKGPGRFIDIARLLKNRRKDVKFTMIGDGDLMERIQEMIMELNLDKDISLTGFLDIEKTQALLRKMNLLVVPSIAEPFGIVALEGAINRIPVVVSEIAGIREFIPDMTMASHWDVFTYVNKIEEILDSPALRNRLVEASYLSAIKLTWKNAAISITSIYQDARSGKKSQDNSLVETTLIK